MSETFGDRGQYQDYHFIFQNYKSDLFDLNQSSPIRINRTFFNNGLLSISGIYNSLEPDPTLLIGLIKYGDRQYYCSVNERGNNGGAIDCEHCYQQKAESTIVCDSQTEITDDLIKNHFYPTMLSEGSIEYFGNLGPLQDVLEREFYATKFASRLRPAKESVDIGETLTGRYAYIVKNGIGYLCFQITGCNTVPDDEEIAIVIDEKEYKVCARVCRMLESIFSGQHLGMEKSRASGSIYWYEPMNWMKIEEAEKRRAVHYAVYLWQGKDKERCA